MTITRLLSRNGSGLKVVGSDVCSNLHFTPKREWNSYEKHFVYIVFSEDQNSGHKHNKDCSGISLKKLPNSQNLRICFLQISSLYSRSLSQ